MTEDISKRTIKSILKPFADFADPTRRFSRDLKITAGSSIARRQLTMGDCYDAADALHHIDNNAGRGRAVVTEQERDLASLHRAVQEYLDGDTFWIAEILLATIERETGFTGAPRDRRDYDHG